MRQSARGEPLRLEGVGLHGGRPSSLTLERVEGPSRLSAEGASAPLGALEVVRADLGVTVRLGPDGPEVDLIEHLLSAIGALSAFEGLLATVEGGEVPLLGGGAAEIALALSSLRLPAAEPARVVRPFAIDVGESRYELSPGPAREVEVEIDFAHASIGKQSASWSGDVGDFTARVAPARTFGFARDHAALVASGRARGARVGPVLVYDERGPLPGCEPVGRDEPARHKLLDLIGDAGLFGGPFLGRLRARRPGHRATRVALGAAVSEGAIEARPGRGAR